MIYALKLSNSLPTVRQHFQTSTVVSGLAYTPAQIQECVSRGVPVTNFSAAEMFYDGDVSTTFDSFDASTRRGYDIVDAWNDQKSSREKLSKAYQDPSVMIDNIE